MTTSGEPDWIEQILQRAEGHTDSPPSSAPPAAQTPKTGHVSPPASSQPAAPVAAPAPAPEPMQPPAAQASPPTAAQPVVRTTPPAVRTTPPDLLSEIRWVDTTETVPTPAPAASSPKVASRPAAAAASSTVVSRPAPAAASPTVASRPAAAAPALTTPPAPAQVRPQDALVPEAVGRSAWSDELVSLDKDPDGWDKLSWQDLDDKNASNDTPLQEQTGFGRVLREWGPVLFGAIVIALFTRLVLVQAYHIPSESMVPTLEAGDRVVVNRLSYQLGDIDRGQVVVFSKPAGTEGENDLIKRVIGLPGETIRFVDNQVYIDGFRVDEPYLRQQDSTRPRLSIPGCAQDRAAADSCVIPEGHVFMMGDNRLGSSDSRVFGPIEIDTIVGRAFSRVWPLNHFGQL